MDTLILIIAIISLIIGSMVMGFIAALIAQAKMEGSKNEDK